MPIYEYECPTCGQKAEFLTKFDDTTVRHCTNPECKDAVMERVISSGTSFRIGGRGVHKPTSRLD